MLNHSIKTESLSVV